MAIPTNAFTTFDSIGNREQLLDMIASVSPTDTPFMSGIGKAKATATFVEWQTDALAAAAANSQLEGDDYSAAAITPTVRIGNRCQISAKPFTITRTEDIINKAGRGTEMAYQLVKKTKELKRDMEFVLTQNQASVTGNTTTARKLGSLETMLTTNDVINGDTGGGFTSGNWVLIGDGTQRAFTESLLKTAWQNCFTSGGDPDVLMVGPFNKSVVSGFTGNATRMDKSEDMKLVAAIDVYVGDFGEVKVKPNRFQRERTAFLLQMDMFQVAYLDPITPTDLGKTGDANKKLLTVEYTLVGKNDAASSAIRSLTTS
jgi:hypothetical protein